MLRSPQLSLDSLESARRRLHTNDSMDQLLRLVVFSLPCSSETREAAR